MLAALRRRFSHRDRVTPMTLEEAHRRVLDSIRHLEETIVSTFADLQAASDKLSTDVGALQAAVAAEQSDPSTHLSTADQATLDGVVTALTAADATVEAQTAALTPPPATDEPAPAEPAPAS